MAPPSIPAICASGREIYERPLEFWRSFIGTSMHYHLGHLPSPSMSIDSGMELAVDNLVALAGRSVRGSHVLDIGCGWGGRRTASEPTPEALLHHTQPPPSSIVRRRLHARPARVRQPMSIDSLP
jgi:hypothetical protein